MNARRRRPDAQCCTSFPHWRHRSRFANSSGLSEIPRSLFRTLMIIPRIFQPSCWCWCCWCSGGAGGCGERDGGGGYCFLIACSKRNLCEMFTDTAKESIRRRVCVYTSSQQEQPAVIDPAPLTDGLNTNKQHLQPLLPIPT